MIVLPLSRSEGVESSAQEMYQLSTGLLRFPFVFFHRSLVDHTREEEDVATHGALSSIDMSDEYDIEMLFD